jgi:hypothetical protein
LSIIPTGVSADISMVLMSSSGVPWWPYLWELISPIAVV